MKTLPPAAVALIVNALREKAENDRIAARAFAVNDRTRNALEGQAAVGEDLADEIEGCMKLEIHW